MHKSVAHCLLPWIAQARLDRTMSATPLVVDSGGHSVRVGWAGQDAPSIVAPNATGRVRTQIDPFVADQVASHS